MERGVSHADIWTPFHYTQATPEPAALHGLLLVCTPSLLVSAEDPLLHLLKLNPSVPSLNVTSSVKPSSLPKPALLPALHFHLLVRTTASTRRPRTVFQLCICNASCTRTRECLCWHLWTVWPPNMPSPDYTELLKGGTALLSSGSPSLCSFESDT